MKDNKELYRFTLAKDYSKDDIFINKGEDVAVLKTSYINDCNFQYTLRTMTGKIFKVNSLQFDEYIGREPYSCSNIESKIYTLNSSLSNSINNAFVFIMISFYTGMELTSIPRLLCCIIALFGVWLISCCNNYKTEIMSCAIELQKCNDDNDTLVVNDSLTERKDIFMHLERIAKKSILITLYTVVGALLLLLFYNFGK